MKKPLNLLPLAAALLLAACTGKTIPLAIENNTSVGCVDILQVSPARTPVAIMKGAQECAGQGFYGKAAQLNAMANAYGAYDAKRVADTSAHQAVMVLQMSMANALTEQQRKEYAGAWQAFTAPSSPEKAAFCADVARMKEPRYYPKYMINHGASAYSRALGNPHTASTDLVSYDPETTWAEVRTSYLKCQ